MFRVVKDDKLGFANKKGEIVIARKYDFIEPFKNGLAKYYVGGEREYYDEHWSWVGETSIGYVNKSGEEFTEIKYGKLLDGSEYREARLKSGVIAAINENGIPNIQAKSLENTLEQERVLFISHILPQILASPKKVGVFRA